MNRTTTRQYNRIDNKDRQLFGRAIDNLQNLPLQASLLSAGNNATLFLSRRLENNARDYCHEPNDKPSETHHFTGQRILELYYRYQNRPKLCVNGTSSDRALPADVDRWLNKAAPRLVQAGVGHICGGAVTGAMGAAIKAWAKAIESLPAVGEKPEIATVLLKLLGSAADREKPKNLNNLGLSSVKQWSWQTRTPALHGIADQKAMLFLPGGWGTLYEVFFPLSGRQFGSKGIVGIFDESRPASEFVFLSSETYGGSHFWEPTDSFLTEMARTQACKKEFSQIHLYEPHEGDHAIEALVDHYATQRSLPAARRDPLDSATKGFAISALEKLTCSGLAPRDSTKETSRPFFSLMDNIVAAHISLGHLRHSINLFKDGQHSQARDYLEYAASQARNQRELTLPTLERLSKRPAIQLVGSAKEHLWNNQLEVYSETLIGKAVESGFSLVISGCGTEGMPRRWTDLWVEAKRAYCERTGVDSCSELVRVQASYTGQEQAPRTFNYGYSETVLPTALTLDTRIELANCIGSKQAMVLAPGGHAEALAWVQSALNRQLFGKMYTPYAEKPEFHVLNTPVGNSTSGYFDGLLRQLQTFEKYNTIKSEEYDPAWFIDLEDPTREANSIVRRLLS
jgi:predicted Rossmann-fold nucleotide-binding protein